MNQVDLCLMRAIDFRLNLVILNLNLLKLTEFLKVLILLYLFKKRKLFKEVFIL